MSFSYLLMLLNPLLMIAGVTYILMKAAPYLPSRDDIDASDEDKGGDQGGGNADWDWDTPLDLPPGICLMPSDPEPVHA